MGTKTGWAYSLLPRLQGRKIDAFLRSAPGGEDRQLIVLSHWSIACQPAEVFSAGNTARPVQRNVRNRLVFNHNGVTAAYKRELDEKYW